MVATDNERVSPQAQAVYQRSCTLAAKMADVFQGQDFDAVMGATLIIVQSTLEVCRDKRQIELYLQALRKLDERTTARINQTQH